MLAVLLNCICKKFHSTLLHSVGHDFIYIYIFRLFKECFNNIFEINWWSPLWPCQNSATTETLQGELKDNKTFAEERKMVIFSTEKRRLQVKKKL